MSSLVHSLQTPPSLSHVKLNGAFENRNSAAKLELLIQSLFHTILSQDHKNILSLKHYGFEFYDYEFGKSKGHRNKSQQGRWNATVRHACL